MGTVREGKPALVQYEAIREYHFEIIRLKLWYVHYLVSNTEIDPREVILRRVRIIWYTGKQFWPEIEAKIQWLLNRYNREVNDFEREGIKLLHPFIEGAIEDEYQQEGSCHPCGCIRCPEEEYLHHSCQWFDGDSDVHYGCFWRTKHIQGQECVALHFKSVVQPRSPFQQLLELAKSLHRLVENCKQENPDMRYISCGSWLNAFPPFLPLFPDSWRLSAQSMVPDNHSEWWGQFRDHRGGFHLRNAQGFRKTGEFPYPSLFCKCKVSDLQTHLDSFLHEKS